MRPSPLALLLASAALTAAAPALAQTLDRYGGYAAYPAATAQAPAQATQRAVAPAQPVRVLSWPGKSLPGAAPPRVDNPPPQQALAPQPQPYPQARNAPPAQPYPPQVQPYYAPLPGAPSPTPGSTATAPNGVYPPNTAPPQYAYPMPYSPQAVAPLVNGPPLPTSIYAPPQAAAAPAPQLRPAAQATTASRQPQLAAAGPVQGARLYSLHREFGLQPDPTPPPTEQGQAVELVSSIDSGGPPDPAADSGTTIRTRQTDANGKTVTRTAQLRSSAVPDN